MSKIFYNFAKYFNTNNIQYKIKTTIIKLKSQHIEIKYSFMFFKHKQSYKSLSLLVNKKKYYCERRIMFKNYQNFFKKTTKIYTS